MTRIHLAPPRALRVFVFSLAVLSPVAAQQVADTSFSVDRGFYAQPFDVVIATATPGAMIRFTLDGSDPRTSWNRAEAPSPATVRIDPSSTLGGLRRLTPAVTLRAYALAGGMNPSDVDTQTYVFVDAVLAQTRPSGVPRNVDCDMDQVVVNDPRYRNRIWSDMLSIPSLSVVTEHDAMFGSNGLLHAAASAIEVPGSIEILYPDGRRGAQANCGFKPHSHILRKRSLRLYFRAQYGDARFQHDLFPQGEGADARVRSFDTLVLRAGVNDNLQSDYNNRRGRATYVMDELARASQLAMSGYGLRGRFVHLYLNGLYWGLYNPTERADEGFTSAHFGGQENDWFAINHGGVLGGDPTHYRGLISNAWQWNVVRDRLDVAGFADYILYYSYSGGGDWPGNNWYAGNRVQPAPGRVRFFIWDCEDSFIWMANRANNGAWIHPDLLSANADISQLWTGADDHLEFRVAFADRVYLHCFEDGALSDQAVQRRFDRLCQQIDSAVVGESARWGRYQGGGGLWTRDDDWIPYRDSVRALMAGNVQRLLAALRNVNVPAPHPKYYPDIDPPVFKSGPVQLVTAALTVPPSFPLRVERSSGAGAVFVTLDGTDPRAPGGLSRGTNIGTAIDVTITMPLVVSARTLHNGEWSALHRLRVEVVPALPIEIHEFLASNATGLSDEAGERDDWIEIKNHGAVPIDLGGYHLTDDPQHTTKWRFPGGTVVPADGTILVWADDQISQGPLHANFRLSASGEVLGLYDPSGTFLVDGVAFGPQPDDVAMGRLAGMRQAWVALATPTPAQPNRPTPCGHITYGEPALPPLPVTLRGSGSMVPGEQWQVQVRSSLPPLPFALLIGMQPAYVPLPGSGTLLLAPFFVVPGVTDAEGDADFALALPGQGTIRQSTLFAQALVPLGGSLFFTSAVASRVCP